MAFFKHHWFKMLILLPFIPAGILIYSLDRFTGIDESLRLWATFVIVTGVFLMLFFGIFLEFCKGDVGEKRYRWNLGRVGFGIIEVARFCFAFFVIIVCYYAFNFAFMSVQVDQILTEITTPPAVNFERTYSLVTLADFDVNNQRSYGRIGVLSNETEEFHVFEDFVYEQNFILNPISQTFSSPLEMIDALYQNEIEAMIIASNFVQVFEELDQFEEIGSQTLVLNEFAIEVENVEREDIDPGQPFSILLLGLNQNEYELTRGTINTFMLLTVNLEELSFTITSIPRDSYVAVPCNGYIFDKLSHTNLGGPACAISTIEHMFDMEIPYYVMLNFTGFMSIIDVLGGIEVDIPFDFDEQDSRRRRGSNLIVLEAGLQRLNAEEALAFTRHRNFHSTSAMTGDDFTRVEHQQLVFEAMLRELLHQTNSINDIFPVLNVMGPHIDTNLSAHEIMMIAQFMLGRLQGQSASELMNDIHIINMVIRGYTEEIDIWQHGMWQTWVSHPDQGRIADARRLMMINLGLEDPSFSFEVSFDGFIRSTRQWTQPNHVFESRDAHGFHTYIPMETLPLYIPVVPPQVEQPEIPYDYPEDPTLPVETIPEEPEYPDLDLTFPDDEVDLDLEDDS